MNMLSNFPKIVLEMNAPYSLCFRSASMPAAFQFLIVICTESSKSGPYTTVGASTVVLNPFGWPASASSFLASAVLNS